MENGYGWDYPTNNTVDNYIQTIKLFTRSDNDFKTFRQHLGLTGILEGDAFCGDIWLKMILDKFGDIPLKENLANFKRNDFIGSPVIRNYGKYGDMCPFTFLYIFQGLSAINKFQPYQFNKIVEIGTGYGALCIIMDSLCKFKEYVIVDLPEVVELNKKYLNHFPEIYKKVTFVPCNELETISNIDLTISCAAMSECNTNTQLMYYDKVIKQSTFSYLSYNRVNYEFLNIANNDFNITEENTGIIEYYLTKK